MSLPFVPISQFNGNQSSGSISSYLGNTMTTLQQNFDILQQQASATMNGYLSFKDWNTFNNKQASLGLTWNSGTPFVKMTGATTFALDTNTYQTLATNLTSLAALTFASTSFVKMTSAGTFALDTATYQASGTYVTAVTGTSPVVSSNGTTPAISMAASSDGVDGYLTGADHTLFNAKGYNNSADLATTLTNAGNIPEASLIHFTVSQTGTYYIYAQMYFYANGTAQGYMYIKTGSASYGSATYRGAGINENNIGSGERQPCTAFAIVALTAGDTVHLGAAVNGTGTNRFISGNNEAVGLTRIGAIRLF